MAYFYFILAWGQEENAKVILDFECEYATTNIVKHWFSISKALWPFEPVIIMNNTFSVEHLKCILFNW